MQIYSPDPTVDHLLEQTHREDSNKLSNIGFDGEITQAVSTEVCFKQLIWISAIINFC